VRQRPQIQPSLGRRRPRSDTPRQPPHARGGYAREHRGNLAGWIVNAQAIKPGNDMPEMKIMPNDFQALLAYRQTLK